MVETNPLKWFVKDIDIGDSGAKSGSGQKENTNPSTNKVEMFGHRPIRTRSRHECHFATGSSVPMGKKYYSERNLVLHFSNNHEPI